VCPSYWRATFDNGSLNLLDPDTIEQLGALIERIENDPRLTVVVFRSDKPGYFMAHWGALSDNARVAAMPAGPTSLHPYLDNFVRLSRVPVAHDLGDPRSHPGRGQRVRARHRHPLRIGEGGPGPARGRPRRGPRRRSHGSPGTPRRPRPDPGDPAKKFVGKSGRGCGQ
jgi:hypothetical protein